MSDCQNCTMQCSGGMCTMVPVDNEQEFVPQPPSMTVVPPYEKLQKNLEIVRQNLKRPLTMAEKYIYSHLEDPNQIPVRGETYLKLKPDRVAMQDASAQMAILQFMLSGMKTTAVPTSIHCDHLIRGHKGGDADVATSIENNSEIFDFLHDAAAKYGISFWRPGTGIIHQIVLENYAAPGGLMLGTDSHTPNAGGLGMIAIGVGGADAVDAMSDIAWELKAPKIIGVHLTGQLNGWAAPKDVILTLLGKLTVSGGTGHVIEYFGPGCQTLSCTGMATICNMGAELGATTSTFPYSPAMARYLRLTNRSHVADLADKIADTFLCADEGCQYDKVIELDLSTVEPHMNGPFTPDAAIPLSKAKEIVAERGYKDEVRVCMIGSCTNSSYEDMTRAASIVKQAREHGIEKTKADFFIAPGSEQVRATITRDGVASTFQSVGGLILANACGPCIGQWNREDITEDQENSILTSFNRNFRSRNDGFPKTMNFLASPDIVTAIAFGGKLTFNPVTDPLLDGEGKPFMLEPPRGFDLPERGFNGGRAIYQPPPFRPDPQSEIVIKVNPNSQRLELLEPFPAWDGKEFENLKVLVKVKGKCTTDHISAAGKWLKYKGHLSNIATNTLMRAVNAFNGETNSVLNELTGQYDTIPNVGAAYKANNVPWMVITDTNYGEGSAREHAAMQPRYLGCKFIVARSFARIHETNLKKQGILPATFANPDDYDKVTEGASVSTKGVTTLAPGSKLTMHVTLKSGEEIDIPLNHTMSVDQIEWFKAGSALNMIANLQKQKEEEAKKNAQW